MTEFAFPPLLSITMLALLAFGIWQYFRARSARRRADHAAMLQRRAERKRADAEERAESYAAANR